MNSSTLKYSLIVSLISLSVLTQAQDKKTETPSTKSPSTITEEIEVVRPYKPVLADAVKIRRNPDMDNQKPFKPILTYSIIDKKLELNSNIKELQSQKMEDEQVTILSNNFVKLGAGNFNTIQGELYINTGIDEGLQTGAYYKHLSQEGNLHHQKFSNQEMGIFGKTIGNTYSTAGKLNYDRRTFFFYGFDPSSSLTLDMSKQRNNTISAEAEIMSNYSESNLINYALNANAYQFTSLTEAKESSIVLNGSLNKDLNTFNIGFNASADLTSTKDIASSIKNNILKANPYLNLKGDNYNLKLGANIVQEFGTNSRLTIFPSVSAEFAVLPGYANIFAKYNGDVLKTSIREIAFENPFLNENIGINNTIENMNVEAGLNGNVGAAFGYKIMAFYKKIDNMLLLVNNPTKINRFDVIYDQGKSTVMGLEGELNVKASDILEIGGKAQIFNYELTAESEAWFKPTLRLTSNAKVQVNHKLYLDAEVLFQGETYAKVSSGPGTFKSSTLKSFIDLSAGAEYKINKKIGAYLRANNIMGQNYQRYLYYPKMGLTLFGGVNYSF
jgi:outer membrane cobalamin receptor